MNKSLLITGIFLAHLLPCFSQEIREVKEINTSPTGSAYPHNLVIANNKLFFVATNEANYYPKLWVTDGSTANTLLLGPAPNELNGAQNLVSFNNKVYFSYNDNVNGQELWVSDGTAAGTQLLKDLYLGSTGSFPQAFTVTNNRLFFMAGSVNGERRLYATDGTVAGTILIRDVGVDVLNGITDFPVLNNHIYFRGDNGTGYGYGLWKSDGTVAGTVLVKSNIVPGTSGCNYVVLNNKLYFNSTDDAYGSELWVTDGTDPGTHIVKDLGPQSGGVYSYGNPYNLCVYKSKIYFGASDDVHGAELFVTDGTDAGTHLVKDIDPGIANGLPTQLTVFNGDLYFIRPFVQELWKSDGTEAGTQLVKTIPFNSTIAGSWNGKMYFTNSNDYTVWETDGSAAGTTALKVQNTSEIVYSQGGDLNFTEYNAELYFSGSCYNITKLYELCKLTAGTAIKAFSFTGTGNWSNPANWSGNKVPPAILPSGYSIVINGQCTLDVTQHVQTGASITVATGAKLIILGSLNIL